MLRTEPAILLNSVDENVRLPCGIITDDFQPNWVTE
jgi:hypothetical protein